MSTDDGFPVARSTTGSRFAVRLQPRASHPGLGDTRPDGLVCRVSAAPVGGAANEALRRLLARQLDVAPSTVRIVRGARSRRKVVEVEGLSPAEIIDRLAADRAR